MHALFEESGKFLAGRILSEADTSAQVELDSGKRVKVKSANILLKFDKPAPAELIAQAQAQAAQIDLDLAWEFAPEEEFGFADLARDYFSDKATLAEVEQAPIVKLVDTILSGAVDPTILERRNRGSSRRRRGTAAGILVGGGEMRAPGVDQRLGVTVRRMKRRVEVREIRGRHLGVAHQASRLFARSAQDQRAAR